MVLLEPQTNPRYSLRTACRFAVPLRGLVDDGVGTSNHLPASQELSGFSLVLPFFKEEQVPDTSAPRVEPRKQLTWLNLSTAIVVYLLEYSIAFLDVSAARSG